MEKRIVRATEKDMDGDITALCNNFESWGRVSKTLAILQIEFKMYEYYARGIGAYKESEIEVVDGPNGKYLRTKPDGIAANNLDNLPDC